MDNDFSIDLVDITSAIRSNDVVTMRFVAVGHRLLLDFRTSDLDGPMVRVVEPVRSIEERYRVLKRLRPRLGSPEKIVSVWWPRFTASLEPTGVWREVMLRVAESGNPDAVRRAEEAITELVRLEREAQRDAIRGAGFTTLWSRSPSRR